MQAVGQQLKDWRKRRRLSQLDLALDAEVSPRHLSFLETGRSAPSRDTLLRLAERLDVPLRERNVLLTAAGFAPMFPQRPLDDPALAAARRAVDALIERHAPFPALAIDRHWTLVAANPPVRRLIAGADAALLEPSVNVLRLSLHPQGLAPRIANLPKWRAHLLERLRRQVELTADPTLAGLLDELSGYPLPASARRTPPPRVAGEEVFVPLKLLAGETLLSFLSTTTVFGTPIDVTLSELALETFFPADEATFDALSRLSAAQA